MLTIPVKMVFDIYNKPTDEHQYLSPQSCHPKHFTKSIPYSHLQPSSPNQSEFYSEVNIVGMVKEAMEVFFRIGPLHINVVYETRPGKWLLG
jgi:hypothetical protein